MAEPSGAERDEMISQFCDVTGSNTNDAQNFLGSNEWDLSAAVTTYFASQEGEDEPADEAEAAPPSYTGPRTLGGAPAPPAQSGSGSSTPSSSRARQNARGVAGLRTLKDLQGESSAPTRSSRDDDDDEEDDQDFFAGGEKSGLAVQNPNAGGSGGNARDHIENILERARQNAPRPGGDDEEEPRSRFSGAGQTLGGDEAPSRTIPDPNASATPRAERAHRVMHLWRDGFSVDDGHLYRYDDPANAGLLEMINSGRAPLHILNVQHGQEVDLEVRPHRDEDFVQPKKQYKPFSGSGQRLGSPTPGASGTATSSTAAAAGSTPSTSAASSTEAPKVQVDEAQPTLTLQIRLGDGTRLQSRFNTTHTIGDVYGFVNAASPASLQREYALMTTFPSNELNDKAQVLGDMAEFKRGGVVVQKWK
ncbi:SEP-domain-containing protein [Saccharata proteae CBS 121410]|uniref:SEP-domain-containing protein n=1 Tax=Saccharata proteae CBS 121410 TaxID=1314787 RepID=A0A9P4M2R1_9PEZI|nr:SEP-domain-containing protein [Saccharata proteae CBS 121410]